MALARALVNHPRALLLDEPLGALDLKLRQAMQIELKRIQREVGITFVYVTHDQNEALTMSDRLAVMNDGRIEQEGRPQEIYEQPATRFVAGFIGTSNLLAGRVGRVSGEHAVIEVSPDERIVLPLRRASGPQGRTVGTGDEVELTVRPEKIVITGGPPGTDGSVLRGTVAEVVYLGTSTNFSVTTTTGADMVVFQQNSTSGRACRTAARRSGCRGIPSIRTRSGEETTMRDHESGGERAARARHRSVDQEGAHPAPSLPAGHAEVRRRGCGRARAVRAGLGLRRAGRDRHGDQAGRRGLGVVVGQAEAAPQGELRQLAVLHRRAQGAASQPASTSPS